MSFCIFLLVSFVAPTTDESDVVTLFSVSLTHGNQLPYSVIAGEDGCFMFVNLLPDVTKPVVTLFNIVYGVVNITTADAYAELRMFGVFGARSLICFRVVIMPPVGLGTVGNSYLFYEPVVVVVTL